MSDLSDFKRLVHEPLEQAHRDALAREAALVSERDGWFRMLTFAVRAAGGVTIPRNVQHGTYTLARVDDPDGTVKLAALDQEPTG